MHSSPGRHSDGISSAGNTSSQRQSAPGTPSRGNNNNNNNFNNDSSQQSFGSQSQTRPYGRSELGVDVPDYHQLLQQQHDLSSSANDGLRSGTSSGGIGDSSDNNNNTSSTSGGSTSSMFSTSTSNSTDSFDPGEIRNGTTVKPLETMRLFTNFFQTFKLLDDPNPFYLSYLHQILSSSNTVINLNLDHLHMHPHGDQLFEALVYFPTATIPIVDFVINQLANDLRQTWERTAREQQQQHRRNNNNNDLLMHSDSDARSGDQSRDFSLISGGLDSDMMITQPYHPYPIIVRPFGLSLLNSRQLQPHDIDGLVSIRGIVLRVSTLKPELKVALFPCNTQGCDNIVTQQVNDGRLKQPNFCTTCGKRDSFYLAHNMCRYASKQVIRIQEVPEAVTDGETPHTMSICAYDELVDTVKPGDRIVVTGIFRGQNIRINPNKRTVKSNLFTYIDAFHFKMVSAASKSKAQQDPGNELNQDIGIGLDSTKNKTDTTLGGNGGIGNVEHALTQDEENIILSLGQRDDIYSLLARSIAPSVWGLDDVKKGLLAMLIGGNNLDGDDQTSDNNNNRGNNDSLDEQNGAKKRGKRGTLHVLLVGDPGTAKSQLLQYIHKLTTRGVYTSGTASSAAGLTASVMRDPVQNEAVLEPGALVLSDCDICCIDEFDKMSQAAQSILHEAMEQQTVSIAKSGVICSLSARTTILASANPRDSRYNPALSIVQNIDLSPTLLSRFDLIYIILDTPNPQSDARLAEHLISLFMSDEDRATFRRNNAEKMIQLVGPPIKHPNTFGIDITLPQNDTGEEFLPTFNLLQYINYARTLIPTFTDEACDELENCYLSLRGSISDTNTDQMNDGSILSSNIGGNNNNNETTISATPRQLQSLIRISESLAKLHLRDTIIANDVREAARLIRTATLTAAVDPTTGKIDMSALNTGITYSDRKLIESCAHHIKQYLAANVTNQTHNVNDVFVMVGRQNANFTQDIFNETLAFLVQEEVIEWSRGSHIIRVKNN